MTQLHTNHYQQADHRSVTETLHFGDYFPSNKLIELPAKMRTQKHNISNNKSVSQATVNYVLETVQVYTIKSNSSKFEIICIHHIY